jgi:23S rRNA-/tRNA-specific pseudouridylate synthase
MYSLECGIHGQRLCAKRLEFTHPITGENLTLESKMDANL